LGAVQESARQIARWTAERFENPRETGCGPQLVPAEVFEVAAIGPFDQGSPLHNQISRWPPLGRVPEKVDIQSDKL
jgi:hypothetical protein